MRRQHMLFATGFWISVVLLAYGVSQANEVEQRRPATIEDIMQIKDIIETQISPDGSHILYVISEPDFTQSVYNTDIWIISSHGGTPVKLTHGPKRDDTPRWSPDGQKIAYISIRFFGQNQLWLMNPAGGDMTMLTHVESGVRGIAWSPDSKRIAFLAPDPPTEEEKERKKNRDDTLVVDQQLKMTHIHVVDVETKESKQLTKGDLSVDGLSWSPDGKEIAFSARPTPKEPDFVLRTDLYVVAVDAGQIRTLVARDGLDTWPKWSPDGALIAFLSHDGKLDYIGNTYLCVVAASGGVPRNISKGFDERLFPTIFPALYEWSSDSKTLYFLVPQRVTIQLFAITVETGEANPVTFGQRVYGGFSFSRDSRTMALAAQDPSMPQEVYVSPVSHFSPVGLTRTNPHLQELALGQTEVIRWKSGDGLEIEGLLIKPVGFEAGMRYPLLTAVHGGPAGVSTVSFHRLSQVFAGQGYAIFLPNPRGSAGYGETFRRANVKDWGYGDYHDVMSGIDALIRQGMVDSHKLGIMGWSYGGYMTAWAITQTDRFRAAAVGAGPTNAYSIYGQTDIPEYYEAYFGGKPWEAVEEYQRHSPIFFAGNIKTPTLILHGEKDERVPLPQSQELYRALKKNNIPVEFAIYPRQGHVIREPKLLLDLRRRHLHWFNRWLR